LLHTRGHREGGARLHVAGAEDILKSSGCCPSRRSSSCSRSSSCFFRLTLGASAVNTNSSLYWRAVVEGSGLKVADPPLFVIDEHGMQVAHGLTPGTNAQGYRTPDFDEPADGRSTLLFLGDSFTWGDTARPFSQCYVERVRAAGYKTINLGVPATGPAQYMAQAERYVPEFRPDAVCVMFYTETDFEPESEIRPGLTRTYVTELGMLYATTEDGQQLSLEQAIARRAEQCPAWLTPPLARLLMHSAAGSFAATLNDRVSMAPPSTAAAVARLSAVRQVCEAHGAKFFLFLVPTRPQRRLPQFEVDFAAETLKDLAPLAPSPMPEEDYRPPPDLHFNNQGHGKMADFILAQLAAGGLAPRPGAGPGDDDRYGLRMHASFEEFSAALELTLEQSAAARRLLQRAGLWLAGLYMQATVSGEPGPLEFLAALRDKGDTAAISDARVQTYLEGHASRDFSAESYARVGDAHLQATFRNIGALLTPGQTQKLKRIPLERFAAIDVLNDQIHAKADSLGKSGDAARWEDLAAILELTPEQGAAIKSQFNGMKQDLAEIFSRPEAGGGPSPLDGLAMDVAKNNASMSDANASMYRYAQEHKESRTVKPYLEVYGAAAGARQLAVLDLLTQEQKDLYMGLPVTDFSQVDTGENAFLDRVSQRVAELSGGAAPATAMDVNKKGMSWTRFRASLNLREDQAAKAKAIIDHFKEEAAALLSRPPLGGGDTPMQYFHALPKDKSAHAHSHLMSYAKSHVEASSNKPYAEGVAAAEASALNEIRALLDDAQQRRFRMMPPAPLLEIDTGHDPLAVAPAAPIVPSP
jgi:hypothetical protein